MSDTDLAERVRDLEERVKYLESELDLSVDERRFERRINKIIPSGQDFVVETNGMGYYVARVTVLPGDLPHISHRVQEMDDLGWDVEESTDENITIRIEQGLFNH